MSCGPTRRAIPCAFAPRGNVPKWPDHGPASQRSDESVCDVVEGIAGKRERQRDLLDNPAGRALGAQDIDNVTFKFVDECVVASVTSGSRP